jgi:FMN phosphatase YigB (HAD superfamily)
VFSDESKIKCIIFDVGGVISVSKYGKLTPTKAAFMKLSKNIGINYEDLIKFVDSIEVDLLTGRINENEFYTKIKKHFFLKQSAKLLNQIMEKNFRKFNSTNKILMKLIRKLGDKYVLAVITDVYPMHIRERMDLKTYEMFDIIVTSLEAKESKSEGKSGIWNLALKKLGISPKECVFIDDKRTNLIVPGKMGVRTIEFKNTTQLKRDLKILGVKV